MDVSWNNAGTAYVVLEIEAAGCIAVDSIQVNISGELSFRINNRLADTLGFCPGASLTLDAGDGFTSYQWEPGGLNSRSITVTQPGTYQVTVRDASGCSGSDTVHVVAFQPPRPLIDPSDTQIICRGDSITLNLPGSYTSIRWSTGDTTRNIRVSASNSYTVTVTDENGCEGTSPPTVVTVSDHEMPDIIGDTVVCLNAVRNYSVRNPAAGSYTWEIDTSQGTIVASTETSISVRWTRKGMVSVIVIWTAAASPCMATDTLRVFVGDGLAPVVIGEQALCEGDTALLRVGGGPYETYEWLLNGVPVTGGSDSTLSAIAPGTYTVRVTSGDCSGESFDHVLTLIASPTPSIVVSGSQFLCDGDSLQLTVPGSYSAVWWSTGARTPSIFIHQAGSYSVTADSLGCSGVSEEIVVQRVDIPDTAITGPIVACINTRNTYALPDRAEFSYAWSVTGGQLLSGQGTSSVEVAWTDSTGGIIEVTVTHRNSGCSQTLRLEVTISRTLRPRITPAGSVTICRGASVVLRTESGYRTHQWRRNGSALSGAQADSLVVTEAGDYVVDVTDNGGCSGASDPVSVTLRDASTPLITADRVEFCLGESATYTASTGYLSYSWLRDGQTTGDTTRILSVTPTSGGTYRYAVAVIDSAGCAAVSTDLAITALPVETPRLSISGSEVVCDPEGSKYVYSWYINDTIVPGETADRITIERTGIYRVVITDDNGCSAWSEPLPVTAQIASAVIGLACTQTGPFRIGETVVIPLNLLSSSNLDAQGIHSLEARIRYDWSVLAPAFSTRDEITEGTDRIVTVDALRPEFRTLGTLLELPFTTMLGGTDCARLKLDSAWWSDGAVQSELNAPECNICVDVCREGGTRLYYATGELSLAQNRPNPFNASTLIEYEIIEHGPTSLYILDKVGRNVATLAEGVLAPGRYVVSFTASELPSGSYMCVLQTPSTALFKLMILVK